MGQPGGSRYPTELAAWQVRRPEGSRFGVSFRSEGFQVSCGSAQAEEEGCLSSFNRKCWFRDGAGAERQVPWGIPGGLRFLQE